MTDKGDSKRSVGGGESPSPPPSKRARLDRAAVTTTAKLVGRALSDFPFDRLPLDIVANQLVPYLLVPEVVVLACQVAPAYAPLLRALTAIKFTHATQGWVGRGHGDASARCARFLARLAPTMQHITFVGSAMPDDDALDVIAHQMPKLQSLRFEQMQLDVGDRLDGLVELLVRLAAAPGKTPALRELHVDDEDLRLVPYGALTPVNGIDAVMRVVRYRHLRRLTLRCQLGHTTESDLEFVHRIAHPKLEWLDTTAVTARSGTLQFLAETCPKLEHLLLEGVPGGHWQGTDVDTVLQRCTSLRRLILYTRPNHEGDTFRIELAAATAAADEDEPSTVTAAATTARAWELAQSIEIQDGEVSDAQWQQVRGILASKAVRHWTRVLVFAPSLEQWRASWAVTTASVGDWHVRAEHVEWPTTHELPLAIRRRFPTLEHLLLQDNHPDAVGYVEWWPRRRRRRLEVVLDERPLAEAGMPWVQALGDTVTDLCLDTLDDALDRDLVDRIVQYAAATGLARLNLCVLANYWVGLDEEVATLRPVTVASLLQRRPSVALLQLSLGRDRTATAISRDELQRVARDCRALQVLNVTVDDVVTTADVLALPPTLETLELCSVRAADEWKATAGGSDSLLDDAALAQVGRRLRSLRRLTLDLLATRLTGRPATRGAPWIELPDAECVWLLMAAAEEPLDADAMAATVRACPRIAAEEPPLGYLVVLAPRVQPVTLPLTRGLVPALPATAPRCITVARNRALARAGSGIDWQLMDLAVPALAPVSSSTVGTLRAPERSGPRVPATSSPRTSPPPPPPPPRPPTWSEARNALQSAMANVHPSQRRPLDVSLELERLQQTAADDERRDEEVRADQRLARRIASSLVASTPTPRRGRRRIHLTARSPTALLPRLDVEIGPPIRFLAPRTRRQPASSTAATTLAIRRATHGRLAPRLPTGSLLTFVPR